MRAVFRFLAALLSLTMLALCVWPALSGALMPFATIWGLEASLGQAGQLYAALAKLGWGLPAALGLLCFGFGAAAARGAGSWGAWAWAAAVVATMQWAMALTGVGAVGTGAVSLGVGLPLFGVGLVAAGLGIAAGRPRTPQPLTPRQQIPHQQPAYVSAHTSAPEAQAAAPESNLPESDQMESSQPAPAFQQQYAPTLMWEDWQDEGKTSYASGAQVGDVAATEVEAMPLTITPLEATQDAAREQSTEYYTPTAHTVHADQLWWDDDDSFGWAEARDEADDWPHAVGYRSTSGD